MSRFIVLDGPDATGTSTHAAFLAERFTKEGHDVLLTAEPSDGPIGKKIREMLKAGAVEDPLALQMLFTADRQWHIENVIEPALAGGKIVICDRYWHSTIVYAEAQSIETSKLRELNNTFIQPTCVIFTMPPIEIALKRLAKRAEKEVFEKEDFQRKVHASYWKIAKEEKNISCVDTSGEKQVVAEEIWRIASAAL